LFLIQKASYQGCSARYRRKLCQKKRLNLRMSQNRICFGRCFRIPNSRK
jgi:hypothetical protein